MSKKNPFLWTIFILIAVFLIFEFTNIRKAQKSNKTKQESAETAKLDSVKQSAQEISADIDSLVFYTTSIADDKKLEAREMFALTFYYLKIQLEIVEAAAKYVTLPADVENYIPKEKLEMLDEIDSLTNVYFGKKPFEERVSFIKEYFKKRFDKEIITVEPPEAIREFLKK